MPFNKSYYFAPALASVHSVHFNVECTLSSRTWVFNLQPTRLYYVVCGHVYKSCVYHKNTQQLRQLGIPLIFPRAAHCHTKVGDPWTRALGYALISGSFTAAHSLIVSSSCLFTHRNRTSEQSASNHII
jgi:hypothetical protein